MKLRWLVGLVLLLGACTSGDEPAVPTSTLPPDLETTTTSFTTTTLQVDTCTDVAGDAAELLRDIADEVNTMTAAEFVDRRRWPEQLFFLENEGVQLDARAEVLGCDPGSVQAAAFAQLGDLDVDSYPVRELARLLLGGAG